MSKLKFIILFLFIFQNLFAQKNEKVKNEVWYDAKTQEMLIIQVIEKGNENDWELRYFWSDGKKKFTELGISKPLKEMEAGTIIEVFFKNNPTKKFTLKRFPTIYAELYCFDNKEKQLNTYSQLLENVEFLMDIPNVTPELCLVFFFAHKNPQAKILPDNGVFENSTKQRLIFQAEEGRFTDILFDEKPLKATKKSIHVWQFKYKNQPAETRFVYNKNTGQHEIQLTNSTTKKEICTFVPAF